MMIEKVKTVSFAVAFAALSAVSASAATVGFSATGSTGVPLGYGTDIGSATWATAPSIVDGSASGQYRSPYDELDAPGTTGYSDYYTVGSPDLQSSPATLTFDSRTSFSMLWGSVDTYNAVEFCAGLVCDIVTGSEIAAAAPANFGTGNAIVQFSSDFAFTSVSFYSNYPGYGDDTPAFEFAVAAIPVPAAGLLLLAALGGLGMVRGRRKAASV